MPFNISFYGSLPDNFSKELSRVLKVLPGELIVRVKDQLTESFLRARDENPGITLDVFLEDIRGVQEVVKTRWGISILEDAEDQILTWRRSCRHCNSDTGGSRQISWLGET